MSYLQVGYSALAAAGLLGLALLMILQGVVQLFTGGLGSQDATSSFMMAYSLGLIGLLCLPSTWTSLRQLMNKPAPAPHSKSALWNRLLPEGRQMDAFGAVTLLSLIVLPITLALGHLVAQSEQVAWLILPTLNLIASGLPVLWLALLGMRKLQGGSLQQKWWLLASGLVLGPLTILVAELVLLVVGGGLVVLYLSALQPELLQELLELVQQIRTMPALDQEALLRLLEPYWRNPWAIVAMMLFAALLVPLVEELLKPLGLWLLAWKKLSLAEGFVAGVLSGAGFALFENLGNTSGAGSQWALVTASRFPAALLHMLTSGMMGWAIVNAWTNRRWLKLGLIYLAAAGIHGLWNGLAVLGATTIPVDQPVPLTLELPTNGLLTVAGLMLVFVINFFLYLQFNRRLRPKPQPEVKILTD